MFNSGVPIDDYFIQTHKTELNITEPTFSIAMMYNDTLIVNISAHNCAGYSDIISLLLEYNDSHAGLLYI